MKDEDSEKKEESENELGWKVQNKEIINIGK